MRLSLTFVRRGTISLKSMDSSTFFKPPKLWNGERYVVRYAQNEIARSLKNLSFLYFYFFSFQSYRDLKYLETGSIF